VLARAAAPSLTADGDGRVNRAAAAPPARAARGELADVPTRLPIVGRGWLEGSPLTLEIRPSMPWTARGCPSCAGASATSDAPHAPHSPDAVDAPSDAPLMDHPVPLRS
jgi:hypothetical protein